MNEKYNVHKEDSLMSYNNEPIKKRLQEVIFKVHLFPKKKQFLLERLYDIVNV